MVLELIPPINPWFVRWTTPRLSTGQRVYGKGRHHDAVDRRTATWFGMGTQVGGPGDQREVSLRFPAVGVAGAVRAVPTGELNAKKAGGTKHPSVCDATDRGDDPLVSQRKFILLGDAGNNSHELARFAIDIVGT